MSLILGVLGIPTAGLLAPFAWALGSAELRAIREHRAPVAGDGSARLGQMLGAFVSVTAGLGIMVLIYLYVSSHRETDLKRRFDGRHEDAPARIEGAPAIEVPPLAPAPPPRATPAADAPAAPPPPAPRPPRAQTTPEEDRRMREENEERLLRERERGGK